MASLMFNEQDSCCSNVPSDLCHKMMGHLSREITWKAGTMSLPSLPSQLPPSCSPPRHGYPYCINLAMVFSSEYVWLASAAVSSVGCYYSPSMSHGAHRTRCNTQAFCLTEWLLKSFLPLKAIRALVVFMHKPWQATLPGKPVTRVAEDWVV